MRKIQIDKVRDAIVYFQRLQKACEEDINKKGNALRKAMLISLQKDIEECISELKKSNNKKITQEQKSKYQKIIRKAALLAR